MTDFFDAPPEGALQTQTDRALAVEYRANKTPEAYAHLAIGDALNQYVQNGALGFSYYDKESQKRISLPKFTFVVLEVYAGISGFDAENRVSYWSNRVKDTRSAKIVVFSSANSGPILMGLYQDIRSDLPKSASYTKFVRAYCIELDRVVEIKLTASAERGMQKGIASAEASAGRNSKWEKVFILSLPDNDHLWGFSLTGYARETKDGNDYAGKGELYLAPTFHAGILNPTKQKAMWDKCRALQDEQRAAQEAYAAKSAAQAAPAAQVAAQHDDPFFPSTEPIRTDITANHEPEGDLPF